MSSKKYVIGVDPSGNFREGKGHTGYALYDIQADKFIKTATVYAGDYGTWEEYFYRCWALIKEWYILHPGSVVSIEDYVLYATKATAQINSNLETPMILGYLRMQFWQAGMPYTIRNAAQVKKRWSEDVLTRLGYITQSGGKYYMNGKTLVTHERDAMKHALHCGKFEIDDKHIIQNEEGEYWCTALR